MGYIKHQAVLGMTFDYPKDEYANVLESIIDLKTKARELQLGESLILGPHVGVNGYVTFIFCPDGSKEGWDSSDHGDQLRGEFIKLFPDKNIQMTFGGDDSGIEVEFHDYSEVHKLAHWE